VRGQKEGGETGCGNEFMGPEIKRQKEKTETWSTLTKLPTLKRDQSDIEEPQLCSREVEHVRNETPTNGDHT